MVTLLKPAQHAALLDVLDAVDCALCERFANNASECPPEARAWLECSGENVVSLDFDTLHVGAAGRLSSRIGDLTALTKLSVRYTKLVGDLPSQLGKLERLRVLYIPGNGHLNEQTLPTVLSRLSLLQELDVSDCRFVGAVPALPTGLTDCTLQGGDDSNCLSCGAIVPSVCMSGCAEQARPCPTLAPTTTILTTTSNATLAASGESAPVALIVGVVIGVVVAIALVAAGFVWGRNRMQAQSEAAAAAAAPPPDMVYTAVVLPTEPRASEYEEGRIIN